MTPGAGSARHGRRDGRQGRDPERDCPWRPGVAPDAGAHGRMDRRDV